MSGNLFINTLGVALDTWFLWLPVVLVLVFLDLWIPYVRTLTKRGIEWVFLEVRIPRDIEKGPKVMEQFFASLHSLKTGPGDFIERYWEGDVALPFSFEIVSLGGEIHFYIYTPKKFRNALEAQLYAYYPDVEIAEAKDYTTLFPATVEGLYREGYDLWGSEVILAKEDAYPIRTYREFETPDDYSKLDPITTLLEIFARMQHGEQAWLQFVINPADDAWRKAGQKLVEKIKSESVTKGAIGGSDVGLVDRTPGQVNVIRAIEDNIAKPGYYTVIRLMYVAPAAVFSSGTIKGGALGAFNQFALQSLNSFKHSPTARTDTLWHYKPYVFPAWRIEIRKRKLYSAYRKRELPENTFFGMHATGGTVPRSVSVFNTEELATLYHFPSNLVMTAPMIHRVESKKVGPPAGLPIFSGDEHTKGFE